MVEKPPLGPVVWLPPRAWCADHIGDRMSGPPCKNCVPIGGPHVFAFPDAPIDVIRRVHVMHRAGRT